MVEAVAVPLMSKFMTAATATKVGTVMTGIGTAMSFAMPLLSLGGTVAGTAGSIQMDLQAGRLQALASENEALQIETQMRMESMKAQQEEANRRSSLNQALSAQLASAAGRGVAVDSGSMLAIADESLGEADRETAVASMDLSYRQKMLQAQARQSRIGGQAGLLASKASATRTAISAFDKVTDRIQTIGSGIAKELAGK